MSLGIDKIGNLGDNVINIEKFRAQIGNINGGEVVVDKDGNIGKVNNGFWARHFTCFRSKSVAEDAKRARLELYKSIASEVDKSVNNDAAKAKFISEIQKKLNIDVSDKGELDVSVQSFSHGFGEARYDIARSDVKEIIEYFDLFKSNVTKSLANQAQRFMNYKLKALKAPVPNRDDTQAVLDFYKEFDSLNDELIQYDSYNLFSPEAENDLKSKLKKFFPTHEKEWTREEICRFHENIRHSLEKDKNLSEDENRYKDLEKGLAAADCFERLNNGKDIDFSNFNTPFKYSPLEFISQQVQTLRVDRSLFNKFYRELHKILPEDLKNVVGMIPFLAVERANDLINEVKSDFAVQKNFISNLLNLAGKGNQRNISQKNFERILARYEVLVQAKAVENDETIKLLYDCPKVADDCSPEERKLQEAAVKEHDNQVVNWLARTILEAMDEDAKNELLA